MKFLTSLDNYNILYEVAKCGNITKASENLYISQPAVSQAIKKLEEFQRVSKTCMSYYDSIKEKSFR